MAEETKGKTGPTRELAGGTYGALPVLSVASSNPIDLIEREHYLQLVFCDRLEEIADRLPQDTDANMIHVVLDVLAQCSRSHVQLEEQALFPVLCRRSPRDDTILDACRQLEKEHSEDSGLVLEIVDELQGLEANGVAKNPDMLGYMLRGYFAGQRRHIDWENAVILPRARTLLVPEDIDEIRAWMQQNDHQRCVDLLHLTVGATPTAGNS